MDDSTSLPREYERDAVRYRKLRDYLLLHRIVVHVPLDPEENKPCKPFVLADRFFGVTFGQAVDTLDGT